ncbi:hypothetical protein [Bacillus mycoides]|uniref:hypothetical protein n=1 Tax=Bacillus mycoides TaxID=1405 RepID=UPI002E1D1442|nr:hypothetical protein [Bacillus mycoides]
MALESIINVVLNSISPRGQEFDFFVETGSDKPPIVCMADNVRNPPVLDIYAKGFTQHDKQGARVKIRFAGPIVDSEISINLLQEDITDTDPRISRVD